MKKLRKRRLLRAAAASTAVGVAILSLGSASSVLASPGESVSITADARQEGLEPLNPGEANLLRRTDVDYSRLSPDALKSEIENLQNDNALISNTISLNEESLRELLILRDQGSSNEAPSVNESVNDVQKNINRYRSYMRHNDLVISQMQSAYTGQNVPVDPTPIVIKEKSTDAVTERSLEKIIPAKASPNNTQTVTFRLPEEGGARVVGDRAILIVSSPNKGVIKRAAVSLDSNNNASISFVPDKKGEYNISLKAQYRGSSITTIEQGSNAKTTVRPIVESVETSTNLRVR